MSILSLIARVLGDDVFKAELPKFNHRYYGHGYTPGTHQRKRRRHAARTRGGKK